MFSTYNSSYLLYIYRYTQGIPRWVNMKSNIINWYIVYIDS